MAVDYKSPGVFVEEIARFPPSIAPVETAIPAFIGYTEKADEVTAGDLHLIPTRISSLKEYETYFGAAQKENAIKVTITHSTANGTVTRSATLDETKRSKHILYYAMQMFFSNGGGPCYIVSVGTFKPVGSDLEVKDFYDPANPVNGLDAIRTEDEPTLIVIPEAQNLSDISKFDALETAALKQCFDLQDRFVIMDIHGDTHSLSDPKTKIGDAVAAFRQKGLTETDKDHLKYGAAYAPNITTIIAFDYDESATDVVVDGAAAVKLDKVDNQTHALAMAAIGDMAMNLPPSSTIAGVYASVDNSRGVWKAPANVSLANVIGPALAFTTADQDGMNIDATAGKSVNAIRSFTGLGNLVWGARTLAGNDNEWRYVNVRRFFIFVEESTKKATRQFVFEPNDANTWVKVQGMIENFLTTQWRQGALQGVKPEHAFYVAVGLGKTMTALDILEGRMIVEIGMAAVRPAEFIILRFSHMMAQS
jgi:Bacteriophage tail sheath protein